MSLYDMENDHQCTHYRGWPFLLQVLCSLFFSLPFFSSSLYHFLTSPFFVDMAHGASEACGATSQNKDIHCSGLLNLRPSRRPQPGALRLKAE